MTTTDTLERPTTATKATPQNYVTPRTNIVETSAAFVLTAEMPGVAKTGLDITVDGTELTILGHRKPAETVGKRLHGEVRPADYRRVFDLGEAVDTEKIQAGIEQGVLTLTLPKPEVVKPRKIEIS